MKLFSSRLDLAHKLHSLLLEGNTLKNLGSAVILKALWVRQLEYRKGGRDDLFSCPHYRLELLRQERVLAPYITVMQLLRMLSTIPL